MEVYEMKGDEKTVFDEPDISDKKQQRVRSGDTASPLFVFIFYLIVGVIIVWSSQTVQTFLVTNLIPIGIITAIVVLSVVIGYTRIGGFTVSVKRRIAFINYGAIPILLLLVVAVYILPEYHVIILRSFFLLIVCLLPATLYYLFIASSKSSLLHEYFTILSRLGLLGRQIYGTEESANESELERKVRVMSYIEKFESVYGSIPADLAGEIVDSTNPDEKDAKVPAFHKYSTEKMLGGIFTPETTIPVVLATLLIGLGWILTLPPWELVQAESQVSDLKDMALVLKPEAYTVNFAFLGAYFFSLQMLFRRYLRKDLRGNAYTAVSLRIILAIIGIWALVQALPIVTELPFVGDYIEQNPSGDANSMLVIGFVIGAFPPLVWQIIQSAFKFLTGARFFVPSLRSVMPVNELDGLTVWHEARLEEEDIENVPNMATADIVELMLHTRIPRERIIDWVDQALLYTVLGPEKADKSEKEKRGDGEDEGGQVSKSSYRAKLRRHGIRTATDLIVAYEKSKEQNELESFEKILPTEGRHCIQSIVDVLSTYPNVKVIMRWRFLKSSQSLLNNTPQTV
jgi:hypothetical protein